nr:hypothetical protein JVH1_1032 [Rhodococcus sp. JVH1]
MRRATTSIRDAGNAFSPSAGHEGHPPLCLTGTRSVGR